MMDPACATDFEQIRSGCASCPSKELDFALYEILFDHEVYLSYSQYVHSATDHRAHASCSQSNGLGSANTLTSLVYVFSLDASPRP